MDLTDAPTSFTERKSTPLTHIQISDIEIPATGAPIVDRKMRLRRLDVFPGGTIGLHDHANPPAILFVLHGSMTVYDDQSDHPIIVQEGEAVTELGVKHYAVNNSARDPLALLTFDLLDDGTPGDRECSGC